MSTTPPPTVIITTKNTASLTMGIISLVVGVMALLVGWVPFVGILAIPVAVIGILLAAIGFIIALFKKGQGIGMPILGGLICCGAIVLIVASTGSTSLALAESMDAARKQANSPRQETASLEAAERAAYIRDHLVLYDVEARYMDAVLEKRVPGVLFKIRNSGTRSLDEVAVTIYFKDSSGTVVYDREFHPVLVSKYSFSADSNKPLKPGYIWQMESGKFYAASSVPSEWKEGSVTAKITDITFSAGEPTSEPSVQDSLPEAQPSEPGPKSRH